MKRGFTILELLVASLLLGMLVTILTMIFNQSAIAWRTGKAGVADMSESERNIARTHWIADNVLPFTGGENYCVVSPWYDRTRDDFTPGSRGIVKMSSINNGINRCDAKSGSYYDANAGKSSWKRTGLGNPEFNNGSMFIVGVRSAGPDLIWDTADDISTWPDEIE